MIVVEIFAGVLSASGRGAYGTLRACDGFPTCCCFHYGIDQVIESAEGTSAENDQVIQRLNAQQLPFLMNALHGPGVVMNANKSGFVPGAMLFQDALHSYVTGAGGRRPMHCRAS